MLPIHKQMTGSLLHMQNRYLPKIRFNRVNINSFTNCTSRGHFFPKMTVNPNETYVTASS